MRTLKDKIIIISKEFRGKLKTKNPEVEVEPDVDQINTPYKRLLDPVVNTFQWSYPAFMTEHTLFLIIVLVLVLYLFEPDFSFIFPSSSTIWFQFLQL